MAIKIHNKQFASLVFSHIFLILGGCAQFLPFEPDQDISRANVTVLGDAPFPAYIAEAGKQEEILETEPYLPETISDTILAETSAATEAENATSDYVDTDIFGSPDIWDRIRNRFALPEHQHKRIERELSWFKRHPEYLDRVAERARPYIHFIVEEIEKHDIPGEIALLPIVESAFQPFAYSHGRAAGIWQFIPSTGRLYGLKQTWWYDGRRDIYASTKAAVKLLNRLNKQFNGDWFHALAAYNSGSGNVRRAIRKNKRRGRSTDFFSLHLPPETRGYVPKLLALKRLFEDPAKYGITLKSIPDEPYFEKVAIDSQIDLALAADLAQLDMDELYQLNPAFNRWATDPRGPHYILLPRQHVEPFTKALTEIAPEQRIRWIRHKIREGEVLGTIARKYKTSVASIKRHNRIRGNRIRAGKSLLIPVARRSAGTYKLSAEQRISNTQNVRRKGNKYVHLVKNGDTLWGIAQQYGVGVRQLAKWNGMAPRDTLKPGQKLVVWAKHKVSASSITAVNYQIPPQRRVTKRIGYRVRKGDSLARISSKFNVSIKQLRRWNKLEKGKYLQPGQRLTLYVDVTRQSG